MNFSKIDKEAIPYLEFPHQDILTNQEEKIKRLEKLKVAMVIGNAMKYKCKIYFADESSNRLVETTVWFVSEKHVCMKSGITIPIERVIDVKF